MLLEGKNAVVYGAGGAIGGAAALAFAREGARVFLAGRTAARLDDVAKRIADLGGTAEIAELDALDQEAVDAHADDVAARAGSIDIALNAVGFVHDQGTPFADLPYEDYADPVVAYTKTNFITAKAVARHMTAQRSGAILTLSTPGARMSGAGFLGNGVSSAAVEAFSRILAGELGPSGVRVVCLRPHAIPEALAISHTGEVFGRVAARSGGTVETLVEHMSSMTLLKRLPTLAEVADFAAFVASDRAGSMTGAIVNLSSGALVD
ncbi:MAG TPA: SDR family oxidoreductase [Jiangellaceae bacterium]|nr:SDR family oxidoreductase [Jiangellaceae bacterium]